MPWEAWVTLATVALALYALARNLAGPDVILLGGAVFLSALSVVSDRLPGPGQLAAAFGNEGVLTIAALFVVAAGLVETGAIHLIAERLLGTPRTPIGARLRLMMPVAGISAFLNNTPVVAMFIPVISEWSKRTGISSSKLFLPLSYAAVLGGVCTLVGTSTTLVVQALLVEARRSDPAVPLMSMFTISPIGVPVAVAGLAYVLVAARRLPDRQPFLAQISDAREYTVEMVVQPKSPVEGQTIENAGLRRLPGVFLSAIERNGEPLVAVGPEQVLHGNDRLVFVGTVESVVDLQKIRGLLPATDQVFKLTASRLNRLLVEAVVSDASPVVGKTVRASRFRNRYDAAVIAVCRNGVRLPGKIGDIALRPGDTLLLQAHADFVVRHRNNRDFLLIAAVEGSRPVRHDRAWIALAVTGAMIAAASLAEVTGFGVFGAALLAAALMGVTGCLSAEQARRSLELRVLIAIVAALFLGRALEQTGVAQTVAGLLIGGLRDFGPWGVLFGVYLMTLVFTELVTNNAAAALSFPIAHAAATALDVSLLPFAIAIAIAASAGFASPMGYQTHLMVYGPGGYRFSDFMRLGAPLDVLCMAIAVGLIPLVYPF